MTRNHTISRGTTLTASLLGATGRGAAGRAKTTFAVLCLLLAATAPTSAADIPRASSSREGAPPSGALDGNRFDVTSAHAWKGAPAQEKWFWQIDFDQPRDVGAILQIVGDDAATLRNAPQKYVWQASADGASFTDLPGTAVADERRMYRLLRFKKVQRVKSLRIVIDAATGEFPTLREVEFFDRTDSRVEFSEWAVAVSMRDGAEEARGERSGQAFLPLARQCEGWQKLRGQQIWLGWFEPEFVSAEPRPLCAFLSGNLSDWCQKDRADWRGTARVLKEGALPMWAACGGAQGLAILAETGVDKPWDCPHCRDPANPLLPIYGHIGHRGLAKLKCGDYSQCLFETGPHQVKPIAADPVFAGLDGEFEIMESHCGQIEFAPKGWVQIATCGKGGKTRMQCLRVKDRYIYAAQFHIEMEGTPANSRTIMANFLALARRWGGYNPRGQPVAPPEPLDE